MSTNDWLILGLAPGIRGRRFDSLLARFGDVSSIIAAGANELGRSELRQPTIDRIVDPDERLLERCHEWLRQDEHHLVTREHPAYPPLLIDIFDAPTILFVRGDVEALTLPQLAIVGSRNGTPGGVDTARRFAAHLANAGFCITSGLALGIDAAAHDGALRGGGRTVAVCATGPDIVYPRRHEELADAIAASGAVVTEFAVGTGARREQFPQRNRLISGMSVGTLVVEAGLRSGALITARYAAEQGREVFAVPGSIHNPTARGCHRLIRNGAKLVETSDDIIEELPGMLAAIGEHVEQNVDQQANRASTGLDPEYQRLLEFMGWDPVNVDVLVSRSGLTADEVCSMLLILELEGRVQPLFGGCYIQREEGRTK